MLAWLFFVYAQEPVVQESVRFQMTRIPVWVTDRRGRPKHGLREKDFALLVDEQPIPTGHFEEITDQPIEIAFLLDISGSMALGGKLAASIETITALIGTSREKDWWTLFGFADGRVLRFLGKDEAARWPISRTALRGYGKTALYDALAMVDKLFFIEEIQNKAVVLLTDGNDNNSRIDEARMFAILSVLDVPVFTVAIADRPLPPGEPPPDIATLRDIARISGGQVFHVGGSDTITTIWSKLEGALRPHYLLGITVERGSGDRPHRISVRLPRNRRLEVRSRRGYVGSLPSPGG